MTTKMTTRRLSASSPSDPAAVVAPLVSEAGTAYHLPFVGLHLTAAGLESGVQGWAALVPLAPGQDHERLILYLPESLRARLRLEPLEDGPGTGWCTQPCCQEQLALPLDGAR